MCVLVSILTRSFRLCANYTKVSTLYLFQTILAAQKTFPRDQPHRDLVSLVTYVLRKFFKALEEEPFLAVEVRLFAVSPRPLCAISVYLYFSIPVFLKANCAAGVLPEKPGPVEGVLQLGTAGEGCACASSGEARGQRGAG